MPAPAFPRRRRSEPPLVRRGGTCFPAATGAGRGGKVRRSFFHAYGLWHLGEGFQTILLMWYMTFAVGLPAGALGFYQALQLIPFLIFTALGGSVTDRVGARASFLAATGLFALVLGGYGLWHRAFGFSPPAFAAYCLLSGLFSALSNPAIDTFIPEATPRPAPQNALLAATVHNIAKLAGNAATLLLPLAGAMGGFALNGAIMAGSVAALAAATPRAAAGPRAAARGNGPAPARLIRHFRDHPASLDILLASAMLGLFVIPAFYIFHPITLRQNFPDRAGLIGLTGVIGWVGAIIASGGMARLGPRLARPGRVALAVWAGTALLLAALPAVRGFGLLLAVLLVLGGNSAGKALVYGHYLRDAPAGDRALLIGIDQTAFWGLATLGTAVLGRMIDRWGFAAVAVLDAGAILTAVGLLALRGRLWRLGAG